MKIDTKEKYEERFLRRRVRMAKKVRDSDREQAWANHLHSALPARLIKPRRVKYQHGWGSKPDHAARVVSLENAFTLKPEKSKDWFPNVGGIRIVGNYGSCDRTLVAWSEEVNTVGPSNHSVTEYFAYAYPCTVDHGWKQHRTDKRTLGGLVRSAGEKGEHRDSLGRTW